MEPQDTPLDLSVRRTSVIVDGEKLKPLYVATDPQPPSGHGDLLKPLATHTLNTTFPLVSNVRTPSTEESGTTRKSTGAPGANRMSYPREFKLMVIDYYNTNAQNKYRTCKRFQITKSMLNGWLAKLDKIVASRPGSLKSGRSGRRPQFPTIEIQLNELYRAQVDAGAKVGNRWLRETARTLAQRQCSTHELAGMCQFSERWLSNFKKRYFINLNSDWGSSCSSSDLPTKATSPKSDCTSSPVSSGGGNDDANKVSPLCPITPVGRSPNESKQPLNLCISKSAPMHSSSRPRLSEIEVRLHQRIVEKLTLREPISNAWMMTEARLIANTRASSDTTSDKLNFNEHWLQGFKRRYGFGPPPNKSIYQSVRQPQQPARPSAAAGGTSAALNAALTMQACLLNMNRAAPVEADQQQLAQALWQAWTTKQHMITSAALLTGGSQANPQG